MADTTLKETAYQYLKNQILHCVLAPGQTLDEKSLADELKTSRTPIREALIKLELDGLVRIHPQRSIQVSPISYNELNDIFEMRKMMEPFALLHHHDALDHTVLQVIKKDFETVAAGDDLNALYLIDDGFHQYVIDALSNFYATALMHQMQSNNQRIRIISNRTNMGTKALAAEHIRIIDRILAKDYEIASQMVIQHIEYAKERAVQLLLNL